LTNQSYPKGRSPPSHITLIKTDPTFHRAIEKSRAQLFLVRNVTTRSEKFAEMEKQRESCVDRSQGAKDEFEKQAQTFRAETTTRYISQQGKDWK
jgi:hypothetical protein